jgi:hypothetical protein
LVSFSISFIFGKKKLVMVKTKELKEGAMVRVLHDGIEREGSVVAVGNEGVCVDNGVQEFWYPVEEIIPVPITEDKLVNALGFEREETPEGVKYKKGPFRVLVHDPGNFTNMDVWYREDRRHFNHPLYVHELQNHHLDMTKMHLERV